MTLCRPAARAWTASSSPSAPRELLAALGLTDAQDKLVIDYSAGMTKKITLACALVHAPRLLVLDEPFEAVDPVSARTIRGILEDFAANGGTVVLSSHVMDLVERICTDVAIIAAGVVRASGTLDDVRAGLEPRGPLPRPGRREAPTWRAWRGCAPPPTEAATCCATACGAASPPSWGWSIGPDLRRRLRRPRRSWGWSPCVRSPTSSCPAPRSSWRGSRSWRAGRCSRSSSSASTPRSTPPGSRLSPSASGRSRSAWS